MLQRIAGYEVVKTIKYLGIFVTGKNVDIYKNNYERLVDKIKTDLQIWNKFGLSLMGRIAAIKILVLPKLMFLFQAIPVISNFKIFEKWQGILQKFVWAGKRPHIKMKSMCDLKENGGLQMPNLRIYFKAACFSWFQKWVTLDDTRLLRLEGYSARYGWHAYLAYGGGKVDNEFIRHVIRKPLYMVWDKYKYCYSGNKLIWIVPLEVLKQKVEYNENLNLTYEDIVKLQKGKMVLRDETRLKELLGWWYFMQVRNLFMQDIRKGGICTKYLELDKILLGEKTKIISKLYRYLLTVFTADESVKIQMINLAENFNRVIMMCEWEYLWKKTMKTTCCTRFKENAVKMFFRWYVLPEKIARITNSNVQDQCWKCGKERGSFYHMWWLCREAKKYWDIIGLEIEKI